MKYLKFALLVALVGCATTSPKYYPRYTDFVKQTYYYGDENQTVIDIKDSLEINLKYMLKDSLDKYFLSLNLSGSGKTFYTSKQYSSTNQNDKDFASLERWWHTQAITNFLKRNSLATEIECETVWGYISRLDAAIITTKSENYDFDVAPLYGLNSDIGENPYNIQQYKCEVFSGEAVSEGQERMSKAFGVLYGSSQTTTSYSSSSQRLLSQEMGLDIFEITIKNNSSQNKYIDTKDIWIVDEIGNQQNMLDLEYFKTLYLKADEKDKSPVRFGNIERTILTSAPIFRGQTRKAFLPFYPISKSADSLKIYWTPKDTPNKTFSWSFNPQCLSGKTTCLNIGVQVTYEPSGNKSGIKNALIFVQPLEIVGVSGDGGVSNAFINKDIINDEFTLHAIAIGNGSNGEQAWVYYGNTKVKINPKNSGAEFVKIPMKSYTITLN